MEEKKDKRSIPWWGWALGCLALATALGVVIVIAAAAIIMVVSSRTVSESSQPIESAEIVVSPADTVVPAPTPTDPEATETSSPEEPKESLDESNATVTSEGPIESDQDSDIRAEIESNVVEIRELIPQQSILPTVLSQEQLRQRLEEDFAEDYSPEEAKKMPLRSVLSISLNPISIFITFL